MTLSKYNSENRQKGIIQLIVIMVIIILILSFFGFDLRGLFDNPQTQDNFSVVWEFIVNAWENYLETPARWIWENIISFIWNDLFLDNLDRLRGGEGFDDLAPNAPSV